MKRFFGAQWWWKRLLLLCGATCDLEHCHHVVIPCVVQCCVAPSIESTERHLVSKELVFFVSEPQEGLVLYIRRRMGTGIYKLLCLFGWVAGSQGRLIRLKWSWSNHEPTNTSHKISHHNYYLLFLAAY